MISAVDYKLVRNVTKRSKMSTQYAFWTILTLYHKWVRVSLQNFLSRLRFFAKLFLEILQSRWWSDTKITNLKMCFILRKSLQSRLKLAYKWHIWWFRHVTTNSRESRSRNVFHLSQIFCKNFSGAGCGLTQKPHILKTFLITLISQQKRENWYIIESICVFSIFDYKWEKSPQIVENESIIGIFWAFWHLLINEWGYLSRIFCLVPDFLQTLSWGSCRAGGALTENSQIL